MYGLPSTDIWFPQLLEFATLRTRKRRRDIKGTTGTQAPPVKSDRIADEVRETAMAFWQGHRLALYVG
jgi:hypothetical protein